MRRDGAERLRLADVFVDGADMDFGNDRLSLGMEAALRARAPNSLKAQRVAPAG